MTPQMMKPLPHTHRQTILKAILFQEEDDLKGDFLQEEDDLMQKTSLQAGKDDLEEDFQTVPLDDEHWTAELAPDRLLCIHSHLLPHELCIFPMSLYKLFDTCLPTGHEPR